MTTRLQAWGNSQGVRLPKALLSALRIETGASLDVALSPKKDAIIVRPAKPVLGARGRLRLDTLVAAMPKRYKGGEFGWDQSGREVW
jgi:antitoxin MazE